MKINSEILSAQRKASAALGLATTSRVAAKAIKRRDPRGAERLMRFSYDLEDHAATLLLNTLDECELEWAKK